MVRDTRAALHEHVARPVLAVGNEYASGYSHEPHRHRRSQFLYAEYGTMAVDTEEGGWLVPPHEALWIPAGVVHGIKMLSRVATRSVYFDTEAANLLAPCCQVVGVSPLLRQLLIEAADIPAEYEPASRAAKIMALIIEEVRLAPVLPLSVPVPRHPALVDLCRRLAAAPSILDTIDSCSSDLGLSRRSFTRLFRRETGLSFSEWQKRVCLQAAVPRLVNNESVTRIAYDLGYSSPAAFTAMFTRLVGTSPKDYRKRFP